MLDAVFIKGNACGLRDDIDRLLFIPPPEFRLSAFPSPLQIRQGEEKISELRVNFTNLVDAFVSFDISNQPDGLIVDIEPNQTYIPPAGLATSHIKVKATDGIQAGPYTFSILPRVSFPATVDFSPSIQRIQERLNAIEGVVSEDRESQGLNIPKHNFANLGAVNFSISENIHPIAYVL